MDAIDLGEGGWGWLGEKVLVVYYRTPKGGVAVKTAREGGTLRLPWNKLAQWS